MVAGKSTESRIEKRQQKLEGIVEKYTGDLEAGVAGRAAREAEEKAEALEFMKRVEKLAAEREDGGGGEAGGDSGLREAVEGLADEIGAPVADIWAALDSEGPGAAMRVLRAILERCVDPDWLDDPAAGADGRGGRPLSTDEAGLTVSPGARAEEGGGEGGGDGTVVHLDAARAKSSRGGKWFL